MDAVERLDMRTEPSRDGDMLKTNSPSELSDFIGKAVQSSAKFEHVQFFASVLEIQGGSYSLIELPDGRSVKVKKAVSCLLTPQVGDLVLVNGVIGKALYILAVLESESSDGHQVEFKQLELKSEKLSIVVENELTVKGAKLSFDSENYSLSSKQYEVKSIGYTVATAHTQYLTNKFELIAETSMQSLRTSTKLVSGTDEVKALNIDYSAEFLAKVSAHTTMINGQELFRTDGKLMMAG